MKHRNVMKPVLATALFSLCMVGAAGASPAEPCLMQVIITEQYVPFAGMIDFWWKQCVPIDVYGDLVLPGPGYTYDGWEYAYDLQTYDTFQTSTKTFDSEWADGTGYIYSRSNNQCSITVDGPVYEDDLPGSGTLQAHGDFISGDGDTLHQAIWRGNQGWTRDVPISSSGNPVWGQAGSWSGPISISLLPPTSSSLSMQAQDNIIVGDKLYQTYFRGNHGWRRDVPLNGAGDPIYPPNATDFELIPDSELANINGNVVAHYSYLYDSSDPCPDPTELVDF